MIFYTLFVPEEITDKSGMKYQLLGYIRENGKLSQIKIRIGNSEEYVEPKGFNIPAYIKETVKKKKDGVCSKSE